jgi:Putative auto-transporter adhesin, head GIN domain
MKIISNFLTAGVLFFTVSVSAQSVIKGNEIPAVIRPSVSAIDALSIDNQFNGRVEIVIGGDSAYAEITIDENLKKYVQTEQKNGELKIFCAPLTKGKFYIETGNVAKIIIHSPTLSRLQYGCNGKVNIVNKRGEALELINAANGTISYTGKNDKLTISNLANGAVSLAGTATGLTIDFNANGRVDAGALVSGTVRITGSGNATIIVNSGMVNNTASGNFKLSNKFR